MTWFRGDIYSGTARLAMSTDPDSYHFERFGLALKYKRADSEEFEQSLRSNASKLGYASHGNDIDELKRLGSISFLHGRTAVSLIARKP